MGSNRRTGNRWKARQTCIRLAKRLLGRRAFEKLGRPLRSVERVAMRAALKPLARRKRGMDGADGVNLICHPSSESGLGESGRGTIRALAAAGIPFTVLDQDLPELPSVDTTEHTNVSSGHPYNTTIVQVQPDHLLLHLDTYGTGWFDGKRVIGYWSWESIDVPPLWKDAARIFDELWTLSDFSRDALAAALPVPVYAMPPSVSLPPPGQADRRSFGLPQDAFLFLFVFDFHSRMERKNPLGLIRAFRAAFPGDERVHLAIKCGNADHFPAEAALLRQAVAQDPRITLIERSLSREEIGDLLRCCDTYVSLHRSEGFGLSIAEAMLLGKPVIATAYSGSLEFMKDGCCFPVGWSLTASRRNDGPYPAGIRWTDPDIADAARQMRFVVGHPDDARRTGQKGMERMRRDFSAEAAGQRIRQRIA